MLSIILYALLSLIALNALAVAVIARLGRRLSTTEERPDAHAPERTRLIGEREPTEPDEVALAREEADRAVAAPRP
jgi:hypothetical protein